MTTAAPTRKSTSRKHYFGRPVSKQELIASLQEAAKQKGSTPTGPDAEHRKYGLYSKQRYISAFGRWNNAIRAAGLPVNEWTRAHERRDDSNSLVIMQEHGFSIEQTLERKIAREKERLAVMEELLAEIRAEGAR